MSQPNRHSVSLIAAAFYSLTGLFAMSGAAAAQTETFTSSSLLGPTSQPDTIVLPSFDSSLGTLESVVLTLKFNICPIIMVNNSTNAPLAFNNLSITAPFNVTGPGGFTYSSTLTTKALSGTAAPGISSYEPFVGWIYAVKGFKTNNLGFWEDQPGANINLVITPGELITNGAAGVPSGLQVSTSALEWENVSVKYTYLNTAAVPEPAGTYLAFIVGTAMAVFAVSRRGRLGA